MGRPTIYGPLTTRVNGWITDHAWRILEAAQLELRVNHGHKQASVGNTMEYVLREWAKPEKRKK